MVAGCRTATAAHAVREQMDLPESWDSGGDATVLEEQVALLDLLIRQRPRLLGERQREPRLSMQMKLLNPLSESRPESIVRVRLHTVGFSGFRPQIEVRGRRPILH
jgi:hypothetical protein